MNENQLLRRCITRDEAALKSFYQEWSPYVYSVVKSYIQDNGFHKDVMQLIFIQTFNSLESYQENKGTLKNWLATIAIRQCIKHLKSNKLDTLSLDNNDQVTLELYDEGWESQLDQLSRNDLMTLLHHMPTGYKTIFTLHVFDDYPHTEIADMLDITTETSRSQYFRALKWIKSHISEQIKRTIYG